MGYMTPGTSLGRVSANPKLSPSKKHEIHFYATASFPPASPLHLYFRVVLSMLMSTTTE